MGKTESGKDKGRGQRGEGETILMTPGRGNGFTDFAAVDGDYLKHCRGGGTAGRKSSTDKVCQRESRDLHYSTGEELQRGSRQRVLKTQKNLKSQLV